jgi:large-conductance mechanosensitive channel
MIRGFRDFLMRGNVVDLAVMVPMQAMAARRAKNADVETPEPSDEAKLLTEIRDLLAEQPRR